mmetsp:Transcript_5142/g.14962  ORF Transcript_5142/g.14962 Transcript_5142/m.14962 type:complete len:184 (+) Transcript_5142:175-726(+)
MGAFFIKSNRCSTDLNFTQQSQEGFKHSSCTNSLARICKHETIVGSSMGLCATEREIWEHRVVNSFWERIQDNRIRYTYFHPRKERMSLETQELFSCIDSTAVDQQTANLPVFLVAREKRIRCKKLWWSTLGANRTAVLHSPKSESSLSPRGRFDGSTTVPSRIISTHTWINPRTTLGWSRRK